MSATELTVSSNVDINGRKIQVVAMLGRGAIGLSYLVRQEDGTPQVLKIFDARYGEIFKQRVHQFRESRFTSSDSVVGYIDAGFIKDQPYILHEHVQAKPFDETARASKFDPKKPQTAIDLGVKLCQAVAAIHRHEIIHGHLWNGNVFFNVYGDPVIVDPFIGAPTPADVSSGIASPSQLSLYLAPEQKDINGFIDPRTDIWHIGALLCRLYTGKPDLAINELCLRELYKAKVPLSLIRVLWQAIQKSWHSRYPDVATFETALREAFEPEHRKTVYLKPLPYAPGTRDGWSRPVRNMALGISSILVAAAGIYLFQRKSAGLSAPPAVSTAQVPVPPPDLIHRELRAVYVSTVYNSNWPSKSGLPVAQQQRELIAILDKAQELNLNAVVFQVRSGGDSMYASSLEPWSEYLTGVQGQAPSPFYDPLEFALTEAHKRGLQLHAWVNPYRASSKVSSNFAPNHPVVALPRVVKKLDSSYWFDPGHEDAKKHILSVIRDLVTRYDIDGIHFDDYFYPYASAYKVLGRFPDDESWQSYKTAGGQHSLSDWRRSNVNDLISRCNAEIKKIKPRVYFGIAPFGIWRPDHPQGITGMDAYEQLFADSRTWLREGWVDYFTPQLYWDLGKTKQSFPLLLSWWIDQNAKSRHIWPGISMASVQNRLAVEDIVKRIEITRTQPQASGIVFFGVNSLMNNSSNVSETFRTATFSKSSVVPSSRWLDDDAPASVSATVSRNAETGQSGLKWTLPPDKDAFLIAVYALFQGEWHYDIVPVASQSYSFAPGALPEAISISVIDRTGNESSIQNVEPNV